MATFIKATLIYIKVNEIAGYTFSNSVSNYWKLELSVSLVKL